MFSKIINDNDLQVSNLKNDRQADLKGLNTDFSLDMNVLLKFTELHLAVPFH